MPEAIYNQGARKRIDRSVIWTENQRRRTSIGGNTVYPSADPIVARITAQNNAGDYDAEEMYFDAGIWKATGSWVFNSSNEGTVKEVKGVEDVPVNSIVVLFPIIEADTITTIYMFEYDECPADFTGHEVIDGSTRKVAVDGGICQIGDTVTTVTGLTRALSSAGSVWIEIVGTRTLTGTQVDMSWAINSTLQEGSIGDKWDWNSANTILTWKIEVGVVASSEWEQKLSGKVNLPDDMVNIPRAADFQGYHYDDAATAKVYINPGEVHLGDQTVTIPAKTITTSGTTYAWVEITATLGAVTVTYAVTGTVQTGSAPVTWAKSGDVETVKVLLGISAAGGWTQNHVGAIFNPFLEQGTIRIDKDDDPEFMDQKYDDTTTDVFDATTDLPITRDKTGAGPFNWKVFAELDAITGWASGGESHLAQDGSGYYWSTSALST